MGWQGVHWGASRQCMTSGASRGIDSIRALKGSRGVGMSGGMVDPSGSVGVSGCIGALAGSLGAQGPAGVSVASGSIERSLGV